MPRNLPLWLRAFILLVAVAAVAYALRSLGGVVRLVIIGGLLAYLLDPLARMFESRGWTRRQATIVICGVLAVLLSAIAYVVFPVVTSQIAGLNQGFDASDIDRLLEKVGWLVNSLYARLGVAEVDVPNTVHSWLAAQSGNVISIVPNVLSIVTDVVLVPFITFFLLRDGPDMKRAVISYVPNRYFELALIVIHKSSRKLSGYLRGQATAALVVGVLSSLALWAIGVDYYLIVGALAGLANMIPYFGPVAGGVLAVVVAALTTGSLDAAPWIIASFALIQLNDNLVVQPLVLSRNVEMHPLGVLLAVVVGGQLFGLWGLLLAVPAAAIFKVVFSEFVGNVRRFRLASS